MKMTITIIALFAAFWVAAEADAACRGGRRAKAVLKAVTHPFGGRLAERVSERREARGASTSHGACSNGSCAKK